MACRAAICSSIVATCAVRRFVERRTLVGAELLALGAVLPSLELRDFEAELVDLGVAPKNGQRIAASVVEPLAGEFTQLIDAELVELVRGRCARCRACAPVSSACAAPTTIGTFSNCSTRRLSTLITPALTDALPRQPEHQRIELLARVGLLRTGSAAGPDEATNMQPTRGHAVVNQHLQPRRAVVGEGAGVVQLGECNALTWADSFMHTNSLIDSINSIVSSLRRS